MTMTIQDSRFSKQIGLISLFAGSLSLIATSAIASEPAQTTIAQPSSVSQTTIAQSNPSPGRVTSVSQLNDSASATPSAANAIGQVTSVSQLSDVRPTDWAFQALQSLVERYGCIAGYPDR
ncbi:porin, partial [Cyanobacteria bacterium FACHB-63]|nr:porin [Cyanobacteria bacterium FACHB-63]